MGAPLRVLIVDDSEDDALLVSRQLERAGYALQCQRVDTRAALIAALERQEWDVVLGDYTMPHFSGTAALSITREFDADVPFIFVSGTIGEDTAVEAMRSGAQDYVLKGALRRLIPAIEREVRGTVTRRERRRAEERLHYLAHHDALTGLPNRLLFTDRLQQALTEAGRRGWFVGVVLLDLDRFQGINDTLGHATGDRVLKAVGQRLEACLRSGDSLARFTGDEFALLLADLANPEEAARVAQRVLDSLAEPFRIDDHELYMGASLGVTLHPVDSGDADSLLRNAHSAMHQAKAQGANHFQFFTEAMTARAAESLALEHALRRALEREEFELHYQPVVSAGADRIVQLEALLRWSPPGRGAVPPSTFIPLAEESGLIVPLGEWVLRAACEQASRWRRDDMAPLPVAVNVSAIQLRRGDLAGQVRGALEAAGLPGSGLAVELTESALMEDADASATALEELRKLGVTVSLDDFGTGYSSLGCLKHLPVDRLKIDRSFIRHVPDDGDDTAIASAIIAMSRRLAIDVVAEGVETARQVEFLRAEGCDLMQGYFFGRPRPAEEIEERLREQARSSLRAGAAPSGAPRG